MMGRTSAASAPWPVLQCQTKSRAVTKNGKQKSAGDESGDRGGGRCAHTKSLELFAPCEPRSPSGCGGGMMASYHGRLARTMWVSDKQSSFTTRTLRSTIRCLGFQVIVDKERLAKERRRQSRKKGENAPLYEHGGRQERARAQWQWYLTANASKNAPKPVCVLAAGKRGQQKAEVEGREDGGRNARKQS